MGETGPKTKRIRTEEGTWLPATYKSGRYERWQEKQKVSYKRDDDEEDAGRFNGPKFGKNRRFKSNSNKPGREELKNKDQMLKKRKQKAKINAFQGYRRKENLKKKSGNGGGFKKGGRSQGGGQRSGGFKKSRK